MRRTAQLLVGIALLGGCGSEQVPTETTAQIQPRLKASAASASGVNKDLAALRRVTARFHNFKTAAAAGWSAQITPCMTDPAGAGGMGFHYGNPALIDGTARVEEPELLLYEPQQNGRLPLVAVVYIIQYRAHCRDAVAQELFGGQKFKQNDTFQLWGLHAWVWKDNPSGVFADWNPRVTCEHTTSVSTMTH
jgi:hypothetical protein